MVGIVIAVPSAITVFCHAVKIVKITVGILQTICRNVGAVFQHQCGLHKCRRNQTIRCTNGNRSDCTSGNRYRITANLCGLFRCLLLWLLFLFILCRSCFLCTVAGSGNGYLGTTTGQHLGRYNDIGLAFCSTGKLNGCFLAGKSDGITGCGIRIIGTANESKDGIRIQHLNRCTVRCLNCNADIVPDSNRIVGGQINSCGSFRENSSCICKNHHSQQ